LVFPIGVFEVSTAKKRIFDCNYVRYTITDLQAPETLLYIPRWAKLSEVKNVLFSYL